MPITTQYGFWVCPVCKSDLKNEPGQWVCAQTPEHHYPIVNGIARFVPSDNYASSFGLQWNTFRKTQLDSTTGLSISKDRLERILGGPASSLAGLRVLEAGCGAGRFTEILLAAGADLTAADISTAVDANLQNCRSISTYTIMQADIRQLPVAPESFDVVLCIGVIQHTPNPEETLAALARYVKPGGRLYIDHYSEIYPETASRKILRALFTRLAPRYALKCCEALMTVLWPIHRLLWTGRHRKGFTRMYYRWARISPIVDYQPSLAGADPELLRSLALLDTHDTLTDKYKHLRTRPQIEAALRENGLTNIEAWAGGNGIEARARKPVG